MGNEPSRSNVVESDYRMRLRFRVSKSFYSEKLEESVVIDGRTVTLKSRTKEQPLNQAKWVIAGVNGFADEAEALAYGVKLRRAIQLASLQSRNGVDCGKDAATSAWGNAVKREVFAQSGVHIRDDVHGIDVFKNDGKSVFMNFNADIQVHAGVAPFMQSLIQFYPWMYKVTPKVERIVIMLNNVLMNPEPVAQIVLAISTIEGFGQDQEFTIGQKALLVELANVASLATKVSVEESREIKDAILKIHKVSLRQGVLRLFKVAGLDLKKEWDQIYSERSTLVHGLAPHPGVDYRPLAHRTVGLCVRILHRLIEMEIGSDELSQVSMESYQ